MKEFDKKVLYTVAIAKFGEVPQMLMAIEEMAELTQAINKTLRKGEYIENLAEEMADVEIMLEQLKEIFGNSEKVEEQKNIKLERLKSRVDNYHPTNLDYIQKKTSDVDGMSYFIEYINEHGISSMYCGDCQETGELGKAFDSHCMNCLRKFLMAPNKENFLKEDNNA